MVEFEESEAQLRPAEKDAALFKKICQDIRQIFAEIAELKAKDTEEVIQLLLREQNSVSGQTMNCISQSNYFVLALI